MLEPARAVLKCDHDPPAEHVHLSVGLPMQQLGFRSLNDIVWEKPAPPPNLGCRCHAFDGNSALGHEGEEGWKEFHTPACKEQNHGPVARSR